MLKIQLFQIDAFATKPFMGNPAAVMPLEDQLDDETLQAIAAENNLAETAFIRRLCDDTYSLRWFTPTTEVPLCGHATLASAHTVMNHLGGPDVLKFQTRESGVLTCTKTPTGYALDFPAITPTQIPTESEDWASALGANPLAVWYGNFTAIQLKDVETVRELKPNFSALMKLGAQATEGTGVVGVFALSDSASDSNDRTHDTVSRFFAPSIGIDEDPATGAWHCLLSPIMFELTGKAELRAYQAFPTRGADIHAKLSGDRTRVTLSGQAVTLIEGVFCL